MKTLNEIMTAQLDLSHPLPSLEALEADFDADDYDLDCQVFCEFMKEGE